VKVAIVGANMDAKQKRAVQMYREKVKVDRIVAKLGISTMTLYTWLSAAGIGARNKRPDRRAKLLRGNELRHAIALYQKPTGISAVAKDLGVSPFVIRQSLKGKVKLRRATHLPGVGGKMKKRLIARIDKMRGKGDSYDVIAKRLGYTRAHIYRLCPANRSQRWDSKRKQIISHYQKFEHISFVQTARDCKCSEELVRQTIDNAGIPRHAIVSKFYNLSERANKLYESGMGLQAVGKELGMSEGAVSRIVKTRSHSQATLMLWGDRKKAG